MRKEGSAATDLARPAGSWTVSEGVGRRRCAWGPASLSSRGAGVAVVVSRPERVELWKNGFVDIQPICSATLEKFHFKVRGFASELEFEKFIKYYYGPHKIMAAIIFDCNFKSSSDPLPLQWFFG
ncbi:uncharacterized protein LOC144228657 [Crocuta crocuta]